MRIVALVWLLHGYLSGENNPGRSSYWRRARTERCNGDAAQRILQARLCQRRPATWSRATRPGPQPALRARTGSGAAVLLFGGIAVHAVGDRPSS